MKLRAATPADAAALFAWANDPATRRNSGGRAEIAWEDHLAWFGRRLAGPEALILIGESIEAEAVGAIRFETADGWRSAVLSYVVAPEARGRGFGRALLVEGVAALRARRPDVRIEATVAPDNEPSRRLFELLDWRVTRGDDGRLLFADGGEVPA